MGAHSLTVLVMVTVTAGAQAVMQISWSSVWECQNHSHSVATTAQASAATAKSLKPNMLIAVIDLALVMEVELV